MHADNIWNLASMVRPNEITYLQHSNQDGVGDDANTFYMLAEDIQGESSETKTVTTITLRKGLKWSDGTPMTTEQIDFWYNDLLMNEEFPNPDWDFLINLSTSGNRGVVEIVDDYTFTITYDCFVDYNRPALYALYAYQYPKQLLKDYHPKYIGEEEAKQKAVEEGYQSWDQLLVAHSGMNYESCIAGVPTFAPFVCTEETTTYAIYERNPYYYGVDAIGQQLPYIDRIYVDKTVENLEVARLRALQGDSDFLMTSDLESFAVANQEILTGAKIGVALWGSDRKNQTSVNIMQNVEDPEYRELFLNKDFRFALSYAINRQEICDLVYFGATKPHQMAHTEASMYYDESVSQNAVEYDPEKANELLDGLGLDKRDDSGWRLLPSGKRLELNMAWASDTQRSAEAELISDYLSASGIYNTLKNYATVNDIYGDTTSAAYGKVDIMIADSWGAKNGVYGFDSSMGCPREQSYYAPNWVEWYTSNGEQGDEPPQEVIDIMAWADTVKNEMDPEKRIENMKTFYEYQKETLYCLGICTPAGNVIIYNNTLKNVPTASLPFNGIDNTRLATWYFSE